jgi:adenylate cyclase
VRRIIPLACVAAVASGLALTGWATSALDGVEQESIDTRFDVRGSRDARSDIAVVGFDEQTQIDLNQRWPLPRAKQARFVDALRTYEPRLIVYDIQLTEATEEKQDLALYDAIARARPVLLATTVIIEGGRTNVFGGDNTELLRDAGATVGSALIRLDADGEVRRVDHSTSGLRTVSATAASLVGHRVTRDDFPGWVDWPGPAATVNTYSWSNVLRKKVPRDALAGKVVIVGVTAEVVHDVHSTSAPGAGQLSGAEIQADMLATILDDFPLAQSPDGLDVVLILILSCAVPLLAIPYSLRALIAMPVLATIYVVAAQLAFDGGTILPVLWPITGLVVSGSGTGLTLLFTEVLERRRLRQLFSRFVPEQAADEIIERADKEGKLRGVEVDATILFVDLRGFTGFSEANAASVVIELLNRYLEEMGDAALAHGGTVVVYMGDGMMAVFGAPVEQPDHARRALAAAQEMLHERLPKVNAWLRERGLDKQFDIVVALNSGPVMSGTVGSMRRLEYTTIGDTTNVAARLEGVAKEMGERLLMSQSTRDRLGEMPGLEEVGETELRGRVTPERLWTYREPEPIVEEMPA